MNDKILIVDDNDLCQNILITILSRENYFVIVANNGAEAVELFKNNKFDIIVMDYQMPVMDGAKATAIIRDFEKANSQTKTPIIAVSGNLQGDVVNNLQQAGVDDFVNKPIHSKVLISTIQNLLTKFSVLV